MKDMATGSASKVLTKLFLIRSLRYRNLKLLLNRFREFIYLIYPFFILGLSWYIYRHRRGLFKKTYAEDGLVEYFQAFFYLAAALIGFYGLFRTKIEKNFGCQILLFGLNSLLIFCFCEEISWGQRIFNYNTVGYFKDNNYQLEMNLHNLKGLKLVPYIGASVLAIWGSLISLIAELFLIRKFPILRNLIVSKKLFFYFLPTLLFYTVFIHYVKMDTKRTFVNWKWQEVSELLLSLGFLLFSLENLTRKKRKIN